MSSLMLVFSILLQCSLLVFVVAFVSSLLAQYWFRKGKIGHARWAGVAAFCGSSLLATLYFASVIITFNAFTAFIAVIWALLAWRDYRYLKQIGFPE